MKVAATIAADITTKSAQHRIKPASAGFFLESFCRLSKWRALERHTDSGA
jgi:hypothetical protein